jgi:3-hydroxybutyryl-CoA dehydratase
VKGDFDRLSPGESFTTRGRTITEADLLSFAALSADWHPQHSDAVWAAASPFGERIAHGMLLLSYAVGLAPIDPARVVALRGIDKVVFKRPVKIGETIHLEGKIEETKPLDDDVGLVTFLWKVVNQDGELTVRARVTVVWRRGEALEGAAPEASAGANGGSPVAPHDGAPL